jgi:preprotein translocase subunit SecA
VSAACVQPWLPAIGVQARACSGLDRADGRERLMLASRRQPYFRELLGRAEATRAGVSRRTDLELRESSAALLQRVSAGEDQALVLPDALCVVSEAAHRSIGVAVTESQLMAGLAAFSGSVAELRDGEGKGIAAILAAYLAVLSGMTAHVVTLDGYLAQRDFGRARAILGLLGIDVKLAHIPDGPGTGNSKYGDVTYGSYARFVGDYLEDNLAVAVADRVQGPREFAILDEADTILIDESRCLVQIAAGAESRHIGQRQHLLTRSVPADSSSPPAAVKMILAECLVRDYFRAYRKLAGLTATAAPAAAEFRYFYGMDVVAVPASAADTRTGRYDLWYGGNERRIIELVMHAADRHRDGRPVLIRAESADQAEQIRQGLTHYGIVPLVLRPGEDADTARIMAEAGRPGAVTIVVGLAGRGYGIRLGGDSGYAAAHMLRTQRREGGGRGEVRPDELQEARKAAAGGFDAERARAIRAGGLVVLGASLGASARYDDWLRGLAGQRGEPGESQLYLSNEDFGVRFRAEGRTGPKVQRRKPWALGPSPLGWYGRSCVNDVHRNNEADAFEFHRSTSVFDELADSQRRQAYAMRGSFLENPDVGEILSWIAGEMVRASGAEPDAERLHAHLAAIYPIGITPAQIDQALEVPQPSEVPARLAELIIIDLSAAYERLEQALGPVTLRDLARQVGLEAFDRRWRDYLAQLHDLYRRIPRDITATGNEVSADFRRQAAEHFDETIRHFKEDTIIGLFSQRNFSC